MKKILILFEIILVSGLSITSRSLLAQTVDDNYVIAYKASTPITGDLSVVNDKSKVAVSIDYFDGLGRPLQSVVREGSPKGFDVVTFWVYDAYGRKTQTYLPYTANTTNGNVKTSPIPDQLTFYQNQVSLVDGQNAFSVQQVENSDLNRVLKQGAPGAEWQPAGTDPYTTNDRTEKRYEVNLANEVFLFAYNSGTGQISLLAGAAGYYQAGQLSTTKTIDEQGNDVVEYVDKQGRTVCKKVKASATEYAYTYYVYDDLGNLSVVLPPEAVKALIAQ